MDFVNEKLVHYSTDACANCGNSNLLPISDLPRSKESSKLCGNCLEERHVLQDDLKMNVRRKFNLGRSPHLRSCFLRLLLACEVDLEPSGWRTALALGFELKEAGFNLQESKRILLQAGANSNGVGILLNPIYGKKGFGSLTCKQIRDLDLVCDECPRQFHIALQENKTEIS
jgi:hypothetical protein